MFTIVLIYLSCIQTIYNYQIYSNKVYTDIFHICLYTCNHRSMFHVYIHVHIFFWWEQGEPRTAIDEACKTVFVTLTNIWPSIFSQTQAKSTQHIYVCIPHICILNIHTHNHTAVQHTSSHTFISLYTHVHMFVCIQPMHAGHTHSYQIHTRHVTYHSHSHAHVPRQHTPSHTCTLM